MTDHTVWTDEKAPEGINLPHGVKVRWVYDEDYQTDGSYRDDALAERYERERLADGRFVALGCIVEDDQGEQLESLWGIVIESRADKLAEFFEHNIEVPSELETAEARVKRAEQALEVACKLLVDAQLREAESAPEDAQEVGLSRFVLNVLEQ